MFTRLLSLREWSEDQWFRPKPGPSRDKVTVKEVIQPQVPLRLPCYDFTPVMNHTVVSVLLERLDNLLLVQPTPMV